MGWSALGRELEHMFDWYGVVGGAGRVVVGFGWGDSGLDSRTKMIKE